MGSTPDICWGLGKLACRVALVQAGGMQRRGMHSDVLVQLAVPLAVRPIPMLPHRLAAKQRHQMALTPLLPTSPGPDFVFNLYHTW